METGKQKSAPMSRRGVGLDIFYWNPRRPVVRGKIGRYIPLRARVNNFGDLLGPEIVRRMLERNGVSGVPAQRGQLVTVGSVMHFAQSGAIIWGTGVNGTLPPERQLVTEDLDVRAVRGPRTRKVLKSRGIDAPAIYGDPGLLVGTLFPELSGLPQRHEVSVVPHYSDVNSRDVARGGFNLVNPRMPLNECLETIARSEAVVASSLHGLIVAESLGKPAALFAPQKQSLFKYEDYYFGTGRAEFNVYRDPHEAVANLDKASPPQVDLSRLMAAFPLDLWDGKAGRLQAGGRD